MRILLTFSCFLLLRPVVSQHAFADSMDGGRDISPSSPHGSIAASVTRRARHTNTVLKEVGKSRGAHTYVDIYNRHRFQSTSKVHIASLWRICCKSSAKQEGTKSRILLQNTDTLVQQSNSFPFPYATTTEFLLQGNLVRCPLLKSAIT